MKQIKKILEELIKDFKLCTKRYEAFNCEYNKEYRLKQKKYFKQNKKSYSFFPLASKIHA